MLSPNCVIDQIASIVCQIVKIARDSYPNNSKTSVQVEVGNPSELHIQHDHIGEHDGQESSMIFLNVNISGWKTPLGNFLIPSKQRSQQYTYGGTVEPPTWVLLL